MDTAASGIERYYIKNYTGHLMITGQSKGHLTLFGFQDLTAMEQTVPRIPDYAEIVEFASSLPYVETINPQVSATAIVSRGEKTLGATQLFGVVPGQYQEMFPDNVEILEGGYWQPGEQGILLNKTVAELLEKQVGFTFRPGDKLLFTSVSTHTGMRIREVEITGIFRFKQSNIQLDMVSLMDVSNARALAGMVVGHTDPAELTSEEQRLEQLMKTAFSTPLIPCLPMWMWKNLLPMMTSGSPSLARQRLGIFPMRKIREHGSTSWCASPMRSTSGRQRLTSPSSLLRGALLPRPGTGGRVQAPWQNSLTGSRVCSIRWCSLSLWWR